jgi:hypothetical protein
MKKHKEEKRALDYFKRDHCLIRIVALLIDRLPSITIFLEAISRLFLHD